MEEWNGPFVGVARLLLHRAYRRARDVGGELDFTALARSAGVAEADLEDALKVLEDNGLLEVRRVGWAASRVGRITPLGRRAVERQMVVGTVRKDPADPGFGVIITTP